MFLSSPLKSDNFSLSPLLTKDKKNNKNKPFCQNGIEKNVEG